jgi:hypothetical protein
MERQGSSSSLHFYPSFTTEDYWLFYIQNYCSLENTQIIKGASVTLSIMSLNDDHKGFKTLTHQHMCHYVNN